MKAIKKINNNVVFALDDNGKEVIAVGSGLGFGKLPYEIEDNKKVEKLYIDLNTQNSLHAIRDIPLQDLILTKQILDEVGQVLNREIKGNLIISLADHISFMLQRYQDGIEVRSPLEWQLKQLYPEEVKASQYAVHKINEKMDIDLPETEIYHIALHFVNAKVNNGDIEGTNKLTGIMGDISNIIKYHYGRSFDETSFSYTRFVTHLQYLALRVLGNVHLENGHGAVYQNMRELYPNEQKCINKIEVYLYKNFEWSCSDDEKLYLLLHLQRLIVRESNK